MLWWDGYQWHQPQPTPASVRASGPFQPVEGLATAARILVGVTIAIVLWSAYAEMNLRSVFSDIEGGNLLNAFTRATDAEDLVNTTNGFTLFGLVVAGIVFLIWLHRVFTNLHGPLRAGGLEYTPGWAVGWWFVPFANLVKPKQIMDEAWSGSRPTVEPGHAGRPALTVFWWATYLIGNIIGRIGIAIYNSGTESVDGLGTAKSGLMVAAFGDLIVAGSGVLLIMLITDITRRQNGRAVALSGAGSPSGGQFGQGSAGYPYQG